VSLLQELEMELRRYSQYDVGYRMLVF